MQKALISTWFSLFLLVGCNSLVRAQPAPDIRSVDPDLAIPELSNESPAAGRRSRVAIGDGLYYVLYLPGNYELSKRHPLIVEFSGNGGYKSPFGDVSEGVPEGSNLGYGISGGKDFAWLCLPFVTEQPREVAKQWWGSPPEFSPEPTVKLTKQVVAKVVEEYNLDEDAILLAGFSRGAIACNFIGLHDDEISRLWCAMVPYSHYDGVRKWGLPGTEREAAIQRLERLEDMPQFICHEGAPSKGLQATKSFLESSGHSGNWTFCETKFRNHNDAWCLRPSSARDQLRSWVAKEVPELSEALRRVRLNASPKADDSSPPR